MAPPIAFHGRHRRSHRGGLAEVEGHDDRRAGTGLGRLRDLTRRVGGGPVREGHGRALTPECDRDGASDRPGSAGHEHSSFSESGVHRPPSQRAPVRVLASCDQG